jgi:hypothetical protein
MDGCIPMIMVSSVIMIPRSVWKGEAAVFKTGKETRLTCRDAPRGWDLGTYSA